MKTEIIDKLSTLATAAFGLVAALAWNNAIQAIFNNYYKAGEGIPTLLLYAIFVTAIAVMITIWIGKIADRAKNLNIKEKLHEKIIQQAKQLRTQQDFLAKRFKRKPKYSAQNKTNSSAAKISQKDQQ